MRERKKERKESQIGHEYNLWPPKQKRCHKDGSFLLMVFFEELGSDSVKWNKFTSTQSQFESILKWMKRKNEDGEEMRRKGKG